MPIEVRTTDELKAAISSGESEILVLDSSLAMQLKAVKYIKNLGPVAVAVAIGALPLIIGTGGLSAAGLAVMAPGAAWAPTAIVALCIAVGGTIAISLFTDWDYVDLPMGIKLRRRGAR